MKSLNAAAADTPPPDRSKTKSFTEAGTAGRGSWAEQVWDDRITLLTQTRLHAAKAVLFPTLSASLGG